MALRTVQQSANQKGKPAVLYFEQPTPQEMNQGAINLDLNKIMQNMGGEAFVYDTFKSAYDSDQRVKSMVKNFNSKTIELKTDQDSEVQAPQADQAGDKVNQMAKNAVDLSPSSL